MLGYHHVVYPDGSYAPNSFGRQTDAARHAAELGAVDVGGADRGDSGLLEDQVFGADRAADQDGLPTAVAERV